MPQSLVTSDGTPVKLGRELGRGGEGTVFALEPHSDLVAKVYHRLPDARKQAKLSYMASVLEPDLAKYAAWPRTTLHVSPRGPVAGFLMSRVSERDPIHAVYSPAQRRQSRPKAAWDFLLFVARNTAAAFDALHSRAHVVGDVNQGNVMVAGDSQVLLIDCDSFQINAQGTIHLCEVGVSHFTPPELQSLPSFTGFPRTANHDAFGLALLTFHLLLGGRHPYSGVPLLKGVGEALEADIAGFRYAYARDGKNRGFSPPPRSIPVTAVPPPIQRMFEAAFTEAGTRSSRPTARQWVEALDDLRGRLRRCGSNAVHVYSDHLGTCPWCDLEREGVFFFVDLGATFRAAETGFVLAGAWALIQAVTEPAECRWPDPRQIQVTAQRLPAGILSQQRVAELRVVVVFLAAIVTVAAGGLWLVGLAVAIGGWAAVGAVGREKRSAERKKRQAAFDVAKQSFEVLVDRLKQDAGPHSFRQTKSELEKGRDEYQGLPQEEKRALDELHATARERQLTKFLEGNFVDDASVAGVGPARKAALKSFGIETAADVSYDRVRQVQGFGTARASALVAWRASVERRFRFNPQTAVSEGDKNSVRQRFGMRKVSLETRLRSGAGDLERLRQAAQKRAAELGPQVDQAATRLAQAEADLRLLAGV